MPVFVVGLPTLISSIVTALGVGALIGQDGLNAIEKAVKDWIVKYAAERAGLALNSDDPLSDASFAAAISQKVGFTVRTLKDRAMIEEDLLEAASDKIEERTGVRFVDLRDPEQIKADAVAWGVGRLAAETGIYLSDPMNVQAVKDDLMTWGKQQAMSRVASDLSAALSLEDQDGRRLVELLATLGHTGLDPKQLMKQANVVLLGYAKEEFGRAAAIGKKEKRRLQNRMNQRAFRKRHKKGSPTYTRSGIQVYIPVGWSFVASAPPPPGGNGGG